MSLWLLNLLVDPVSRVPLLLENAGTDLEGNVREGWLKGEGRNYPIENGIPRFILTEDKDQKQTSDSFGFKWGQIHTYNSPGMQKVSQKWLVKRYGFPSLKKMREYFSGRKCILDAGCGSGFSSSLWLTESWRGSQWVGADISRAIDVAQESLGKIKGTAFVQADLLNLPFRNGAFDTIFSEGVLHHTPSTRQALLSVSRVLKKKGEILFYVYRKKAPLREFSDDFIRDILSPLAPEQAWEKLKPLTRFARELTRLGVQVEVPEDISFLKIEKGKYDLQRFIYNHFFKLFWNENFSFEENNHVNFDWYHPRYSHRQTEEEIRNWCKEARLRIHHLDEEESGFTVRAIKE